MENQKNGKMENQKNWKTRKNWKSVKLENCKAKDYMTVEDCQKQLKTVLNMIRN